jgi:hypothetical protein
VLSTKPNERRIMLRLIVGVIAGFILSMARVGESKISTRKLSYKGIYCEIGGKTESIICAPQDKDGFSVAMNARIFLVRHNGKDVIFSLDK